MKVGIVTSSFQSADWERVNAADWSRAPSPSDADVMGETIALGRLAEPLGFDSIWVGEHFGTPYSMWPDVMQSMAFWAGETERVALGSCVSVLPWWHPVTLAAKAAMLDIMLEGREYTWGVGRGVAPTEYAELGIDRNEARGRFDEVLEVIRLGLSQERFSFDGKYYQIPEASIRPQPRDAEALLARMACAFTTEASMEVAARAGLGQLFVTGGGLAEMAGKVRTYNTLLQQGGHEPNQATVLLWLYCSEDPADIAVGEAYFDQYSVEVAQHYGLGDPSNFEGVKGYEAYLEIAKAAAASGKAVTPLQGASGNSGADTQPIGTPEEIIRKMRLLQETTSCKEIILVPQYSGMPYEKAEASVRLFAEKVLPVLQADPAPLHEASLPDTGQRLTSIPTDLSVGA